MNTPEELEEGIFPSRPYQPTPWGAWVALVLASVVLVTVVTLAVRAELQYDRAVRRVHELRLKQLDQQWEAELKRLLEEQKRLAPKAPHAPTA